MWGWDGMRVGWGRPWGWGEGENTGKGGKWRAPRQVRAQSRPATRPHPRPPAPTPGPHTSTPLAPPVQAIEAKLAKYRNPWQELRVAYGSNKGKTYTGESLGLGGRAPWGAGLRHGAPGRGSSGLGFGRGVGRLGRARPLLLPEDGVAAEVVGPVGRRPVPRYAF